MLNAWHAGRDAVFHCEIKNQQATLRFETALGSPGSQPRAKEKKKKSLAKTKRDNERAKKHHEKLGDSKDAAEQPEAVKLNESVTVLSHRVDDLVGSFRNLNDQIQKMDSLIKSEEYLKLPSEESIEGENCSLKSIDVGFSNPSERLKKHLKMIDESVVAAREKRKRDISSSESNSSSTTQENSKRAKKCSDLHSTAVLECALSELPGEGADDDLSLSKDKKVQDRTKISPGQDKISPETFS